MLTFKAAIQEGQWAQVKTPDQGYYPIGTQGTSLNIGALPAMAGGFTT